MSSTGSKCWLDRNLGATQVATNINDASAYGHYFQWGRLADGHQISTSGTTSTESSTDVPGHGNFITGGDWRNPQNHNLWQGVNGINNPCPSGFRVPTSAELETERLSWSTNNRAGAFNSPLKLPTGGARHFNSGGMMEVGQHSWLWSSTVSGGLAMDIYIETSNAYAYPHSRSYGVPVRCIKD